MMGGARGPSLTTVVVRALRGEARVAKGTTLLVAVSGGPDSMALLDVLARTCPKLGIGLVAHGVDHGLREGAGAELDLVDAHASALGVPFARTKLALAPGGNVQARARAARYAALAAAARTASAGAVATAHHADDRAETLLMRLLRGAGPRGLAVMPARAPLPGSSTAGDEPPLELLRPVLRARREALRAYVARHRIPFATDPSNLNPRFLRARVRAEVLPLLEALSPEIVSHLEALADRLLELRPASPSLPALAPEAPAWAAGLPGRTQEALARLLASRSPHDRVWLPGGLVVSADPTARTPNTPPSNGPAVHAVALPAGAQRRHRES